MPFLIAIVLYAVRIARAPMDVHLKKRHAGPLTVAAGAVALYLAWDWLRPAGISTVYFAGEFAGVASAYLMTCTLVLATRLRWLEQWFGGLDRMYFWHKQYALLSMLLLAPHLVLRDQGRLTVDGIEKEAGLLTPDTHVFLCGPAAMVEDLSRDLHRRGIPRHNLHSEHFEFR